jgi:hypothetical protein
VSPKGTNRAQGCPAQQFSQKDSSSAVAEYLPTAFSKTTMTDKRGIFKLVFSSTLMLASAVSVLAQGNGAAGLSEATQMVTSYFDPATKLIYAIGAVVGLVGGIKVYSKFSSGDPDTGKTAASWFGACIFLIVSATVLRSFFCNDRSFGFYFLNPFNHTFL